MTTGRINQVTIVRRGWPTGRWDAPERVPSYWSAPAGWRARRASAPRARGPGAPAAGIPLSPSKFPRADRRAHWDSPGRGKCGLGAPGGGLAALRLPWRCPQRVVAPCWSAGARWPVEARVPDRPHPELTGGQRPPGRASPVPRAALAAGIVGGRRAPCLDGEATVAYKPLVESTGSASRRQGTGGWPGLGVCARPRPE